MDEIIISLGVFIAPLCAVYLVVRHKTRRLQILYDLVKSNAGLTPQQVELIRQQPVRTARSDYRRGVFCMAVGLALAAILGLETFGNSRRLALIALLPILLSLAYFVTAKFASDRTSDGEPGDRA